MTRQRPGAAALPGFLIPMALIPVVNQRATSVRALAVWAVLLIALPGCPRLAESIRQYAREILVQPFIDGAVAAGAGPARILFRHVLPSLAPTLATMLTLEIPAVITMTGFLNLAGAGPGGQVTDAETGEVISFRIWEWGSMMLHPFNLLRTGHWWEWSPYFALFAAILAFNLLGEGLRRRWAGRTFSG